MKWSDLPLYRAIQAVREEMIAAGEQPGSERWFIDDEAKEEFCQRVMLKLDFNWSTILTAAIQFRKGTTIGKSNEKKLDLICKVSLIHGDRCFYANRGLGDCSDDVHLDRIVPGSRGGSYSVRNCILACGFHNSSRGDKSIEEFLATALEAAS